MPQFALAFCGRKLPQLSKSIEKESIRLAVASSWGWEQGLAVKEHEESYWGSENVLKLDYGDCCATL